MSVNSITTNSLLHAPMWILFWPNKHNTFWQNWSQNSNSDGTKKGKSEVQRPKSVCQLLLTSTSPTMPKGDMEGGAPRISGLDAMTAGVEKSEKHWYRDYSLNSHCDVFELTHERHVLWTCEACINFQKSGLLRKLYSNNVYYILICFMFFLSHWVRTAA